MKKALVFYGGWEGHNPEGFAAWISEKLQQEGFEVQQVPISDLDSVTQQPLDLDLIVPVCTMAEISQQSSERLREAVLQGTGLAGFHGGMGDAFRKDTEFQFMTGGQFVSHPGNIIPYSVQIADQDHEITQGLSDFNVVTEQYYMHVDPANKVLATTTFSGEHAPWTAGVVMPVAWTRQHGQGKVYYCALGHAIEELQVPDVEALYVRGMRWAAR